MVVAVRAFISIVMLAGFYVLAFVQLVAGIALALWVASVTTGPSAPSSASPSPRRRCGRSATGPGRRCTPSAPEQHGLPLDRVAAPHLWATVDELAAVVDIRGPDEMAGTRLASVSYRGRLALGRTISHIGPGNVAGWVFRGFGRLYLMVENSVSRRQELEADLASVQVAGRDTAASALREIRVLDAAFGFYRNPYAGPGMEAGYAPDDLFAGFGELLHAR